MNDMQALLEDLPVWVQAIILCIVLGGGAVLGLRKNDETTKRKRRGKSLTSQLKLRTPNHPQLRQTPVEAVTTLSPGQSGKDATVDIPPKVLQRLTISYAPEVDGTPDPGEVVWTWVPFAENDGRGKDRPVLIIGRIDHRTVVGCYLSTKQHRNFLHVGPGPWDSQGRPSYLNPDRLLRISDHGMRREGAVMARDQFDSVTKQLTDYHGL